jgi:hypothetical protein
MCLQLVKLRCRPTMRWPGDASLTTTTVHAEKSRKPHTHPAEQRRDLMGPPVLHTASPAAGPAIRPKPPVLVGLRGDDLLLNTRQKLLRFGQRQTQMADIAKTIRPVDLHDVGTARLTIDTRFDQPQNPSHPQTPAGKSRLSVPPLSSSPQSLDSPVLPPPKPRHRREVSYRPQSSIHRLGRGYRRSHGCVTTSVDGRCSTHRASLYSIDDKLTVPLGIHTGLDLRRQSRAFLAEHFGKAADYYYGVARGEDDRPVESDRIRKSIGAETTCERDLTRWEEAEPVVASLSAKVWSAGTRHGHAGRTVTVKVKYADFGRSPTAVPASSRSAPRRRCGESAWNCIAHVFLRRAVFDCWG